MTFTWNVLKVKRVLDRVIGLKLKIKGAMFNVVSASQVGCVLKKEEFWSDLEVMQSIPKSERVVIGADLKERPLLILKTLGRFHKT